MAEGRARRLGVMGGTFDPIHNGHVAAATALLDAFELDRVLFVPAGRPWQKEGYSGAEDRWMMTVLAATTDPRFEASRMEIDRKGPTYTVDSLAILRDFYGPDAALFFIAGVDAVLTLATWHRAEGLADLAEVIVVPRPGFDSRALRPGPEWPRVHLADVPEVDVSSTEVRRRVREGLPIDGLVPTVVAEYIAEHRLYRAAAEWSA
ncbi:MAG TPA: nicotinate-nucleotide adenylyltransferase [Actinomycetota bacterium]|nr:nicotinate-nucleotide adenylyltransferase [Actinomycetota bacterium]